MKDSVCISSKAFRLAAVIAVVGGLACAKSNKTADVAQDSILVKDADISGNKTDTAGAATAALVRERGAAAQPPTLTNGARVARPTDIAPTMTIPTAPQTSRTSTTEPVPQPPRKVYPSPVLPPRESTTAPTHGSVISSPTSPPPVTQPKPVAQPVSPAPPPVTQPTPPAPKKDSSSDTTGSGHSTA